MVGDLRNDLDEVGDPPRARGQRFDSGGAFADEPLRADQALDRGVDLRLVRRRDIGGDAARGRGLTGIVDDAPRRFEEELRHLEARVHLFGFLRDAARDFRDRRRDRLAAGAQCMRRLVECVEFVRNARHGRQQRRAQIVNMQRRRELVGESLDEHRFLRAVGLRLVMLDFQHADIPLAEPERNRHR